MTDEKYKKFRNYMTNELGVTRQDIEAWTKQSVANEVEKLIGQIDIEGMVANTIDATVKTHVKGAIEGKYHYIQGYKLREEVAKVIANQLVINTKPKEEKE